MVYEILQDDSAANLEKQVNSRIQQGFEPIGGVCYTVADTGTDRVYKSFCQAIVKKSLDGKLEEIL